MTTSRFPFRSLLRNILFKGIKTFTVLWDDVDVIVCFPDEPVEDEDL